MDEPYVFLSYARVDQGYVDRLAEHLRANGVIPWFDRDTDYGEQWPQVIRDHVDGCRAFVVVMSRASDGSTWVKRELVRAEDQHKAVLPLSLDGVVFFELNTNQYEDVSGGRLPSSKFLERLQRLTATEPIDTPQPIHAGSSPTRAEWIDQGRRLGNEGRWEEALAAYEQLLQIDPADAWAHILRGEALESLDRCEESLAAYDRAVELDPTHVLAHAKRGFVLRRLGRDREANAAFKQSAKLGRRT
jgi:tetratricopeptide (TPR) repeat protein